MEKEVTLEMTQKQINRYHVIKDSLESKLTVAEAALALGISERQVTRLRKGVKKEGASFLIHKNKGQPSPLAASEVEKERIVELYRSEKYAGANFLHFSELLSEHEGLTLSRPTIHRILKSAGLESPKKRRRFKPHRRRKRKAQEGVLVQIDATPFKWFGGRTMYALHGAIDDATGKILGLYMAKNECLHGYFEIMRQTIVQNGIPISVYADRHTIFRSPKADKLSVQEQLDGKLVGDTQFGRALKELGITLIAARSPQAKGRIERLWDTLQSRLVLEFRLRNITDVQEANLFLADYLPRFNSQFAVQPELSEPAYAPLTMDLNLVLCTKEFRTADNGGVFSFHGKQFRIIDGSVPNKAKIEVIASTTTGITALYAGITLGIMPYIKPSKPVNTPENKPRSDLGHHSHGNWLPQAPKYSHDLTDSEIRKMLEDIFLSKYA
jgi:transposase InsO family protein